LFNQLREEFPVKPRTYRRKANVKYLSEAKKRQKNKASLRKTIRYQLNCVERNIESINQMRDIFEAKA
jgi:hypothetical protein